MSLKARFLLYLALVHLPFAVLAGWLLRERHSWLLLLVELVFAVSLATGVWLVRSLFGPLELLKGSADLLREADFASRLRQGGPPEMDQLVAVYNAMLDRLQQERLRLTEQHLFLEKVLEASPAGVVTLDYEGRVDSANPAAEALLERPARQLKGRPLQEAGAPGVALAALEPGESRVVPVHGSRRLRAQRSEFLDRGFPRALYVVTELTEELRQSEKAAYEKLIRMMSHEVNNSVAAVGSLLTSCLTYADRLDADDREDFTTALNVAVSRTSQLNAFMRSLADVVKIPPPRRTPVAIDALAREAVALVGAEARSRGVALALEAGDGGEPVPLDRAQVEQALVNVLTNALDAAGPGGRVIVRTSAGRLEVEDTGPGVPPEAAAHLFTPFFTTKPNGQGIGLTVVKEVLSQHGFRFALESVPGGARFTVDFARR